MESILKTVRKMKRNPFILYILVLLLSSLVFSAVINQRQVLVDDNFQIPANTPYSIPLNRNSDTSPGRSISLTFSTDIEVRIELSLNVDGTIDGISFINETIIDEVSNTYQINKSGNINLDVYSTDIAEVTVKLEISGIASSDLMINGILTALLLVSGVKYLINAKSDSYADNNDQSISTGSSDSRMNNILHQIRFIIQTESYSYLILPLVIPFLLIRVYYSNLRIFDFTPILILSNESIYVPDIEFYRYTTSFLSYFQLYAFLSLPLMYLMRTAEEDTSSYYHLKYLPIDERLKLFVKSLTMTGYISIPPFILSLAFLYNNSFQNIYTINPLIYILSILVSITTVLILYLIYFLFHELVEYRFFQYPIQLLFLGLAYSRKRVLFKLILGLSSISFNDFLDTLTMAESSSDVTAGSFISDIITHMTITLIGISLIIILIIPIKSRLPHIAYLRKNIN